MKKKLSALLLALALCLCTAVPAFAADGFADEYYRAIDLAELLTQSEWEELNQRLDELSQRQSMDVAVITTDDLGGLSIQDYADSAYEQCRYGYGADRDGVLLVVSMADHDWYIATHGGGITAFTDAGIRYIGRQMKEDLSSGSYAAAFETYAALCDRFITQARSGQPFDGSSLPREPLGIKWALISVAVGVVIAFVVVAGMKGKMKSVRFQSAANSYLREGSLAVTEGSDLYLYRTMTRAEKKKSGDSGSSTHTSVSGDTFGGGGGKF